MQKTKLLDIAKELGISVGTVSKALRGYDEISDSTIAKVKAAADKYNFIPNSIAVKLRSQESKNIGVIIPDLKNSFFIDVLKGMILEAGKQHYSIIIKESKDSHKLENRCVEELLVQNVDGIFISLSNNTKVNTHLQKIKESGVILIQFDKISKTLQTTKIINDNYKASFEVTEKLILKGRKKIALIRSSHNSENTFKRFIGYRDALLKHNITVDNELVINIQNLNYIEGYNNLHSLFKKNKKIDAVFALNDNAAIGCLNCIKDLGFSVPKDIAVVGFSNSEITSLVSPKLSTINQHGELMGKKIMNRFYEEKQMLKEKKEVVFENITLETTFIKRESS